MRELLDVALGAAEVARGLMVSRGPGVVTAKGDRDMASEVDYAVERAVREFLRERTPEIAILGEEEGGSADAELLWAVDPVDGTANFVRGIPLCGFSLGLVRRGRPVVGVIDLPFLGTRYHAAEGLGAFEGERPVRASGTKDVRDAVVSIGDYSVDEGAEVKNRVRLELTGRLAANVQRIRMVGSAAIDLAWVADGKLDACVILSNHPWDTAAGVVIAREAGATVRDLDGSEHTMGSGATLAFAPAVRAELMELIGDVREGLA
ncbi:inositol monophosphatase family protein [Spirillospora sp. NPDC029432]|uniref:inositol monophosphatase family protein n=1 Tax=Spirillospora sp. NPDC029432 TaxID=3154599 RepID=UPI003452465A